MKVLVKVLAMKRNLHRSHSRIQGKTVKVFPKTQNLHGILKLTVKVVTVVKVFSGIRKKNSE